MVVGSRAFLILFVLLLIILLYCLCYYTTTVLYYTVVHTGHIGEYSSSCRTTQHMHITVVISNVVFFNLSAAVTRLVSVVVKHPVYAQYLPAFTHFSGKRGLVQLRCPMATYILYIPSTFTRKPRANSPPLLCIQKSIPKTQTKSSS